MNKAQRVSLLVCVFSFVVFIASADFFSSAMFPSIWATGGGDYYRINYLGMIALGFAVAGLVGCFILGDKQK